MSKRLLNAYSVLFALLSGLSLALTLTSCTSQHSSPAGVVSAATPEAAEAGVAILNAGGNAIDAAVAVSFALGVTEPAMSGLGGGTQILLHVPGKDPVVINGTSFSPSATPTTALRNDLTGHRATTIPSTVRTLDYAWRHYGSGQVTWTDLLRPAIRYAEDGFIVGAFRHRVWQRHLDDLQENAATAKLFLNPDGRAPLPGTLFKQPTLAKTLHRLAKQGADDFYKGQIARDLAADMAANGGWVTSQDLEDFPQPAELRPLEGSYRDWRVWTLPPPGGGWVVLQILNLLEQSPVRDLTSGTSRRPTLLANALRIAHTSRRDQPVRNLVDYHDDIKKRISKEEAMRLFEQRSEESGETTHFSVVDANGMAVSVTASINAYFGARAASPKLGFLYNSYMHEFESGKADHPFAIRPSAMPYSSMSPTILARGGRAHLILGSPGSSRIISAVAQVIQLWVDGKSGVSEAVAAKRIHVVPDSSLYIESEELAGKLADLLAQQGYKIKEPRKDLVTETLNPYFGGVHAIAFEDGSWVGAADPRRDGAVRIQGDPAVTKK